MPKIAELIYRQLGVETKSFSLTESSWGKVLSFLIKKEAPLFPRIDVN